VRYYGLSKHIQPKAMEPKKCAGPPKCLRRKGMKSEEYAGHEPILNRSDGTCEQRWRRRVVGLTRNQRSAMKTCNAHGWDKAKSVSNLTRSKRRCRYTLGVENTETRSPGRNTCAGEKQHRHTSDTPVFVLQPEIMAGI